MQISYIEPIINIFKARHDMSNIDIKTMLKAIRLEQFLAEELTNARKLAISFAKMHAVLDADGNPKISFNKETRQDEIAEFKTIEDKLEYYKRMNELNETVVEVPDSLKLSQQDLSQFRLTFGELHLLVDLFLE